jgi:hypothetical protein
MSHVTLVYAGHLITLWQYNVEKYDVLDIWLGWRNQELYTEFWSSNWLERTKVRERPTGWVLRMGLGLNYPLRPTAFFGGLCYYWYGIGTK